MNSCQAVFVYEGLFMNSVRLRRLFTKCVRLRRAVYEVCSFTKGCLRTVFVYEAFVNEQLLTCSFTKPVYEQPGGVFVYEGVRLRRLFTNTTLVSK